MILGFWDQISQSRVNSGFQPERSRELNRGASLSKAILWSAYAEITRKWCEIWHKLLLFTNMKSHMLSIVTVGDFGRHLTLFHAIRQLSEWTASSWSYKFILSATKCSPWSLVALSNRPTWFMGDDASYLCGSRAFVCNTETISIKS